MAFYLIIIAPAVNYNVHPILQSIQAFALGIFNWGIYIGYGASYIVGNYATAADINGQVRKIGVKKCGKQLMNAF